jgi:hypothetical protein
MSSNDRLNALKKELNELLEVRIGSLLGVVRATQQVTRDLIATEDEIRRQTFVRESLQAELGPGPGPDATPHQRDLQSRLERVQENVERMKSLRDELLNNLATLKASVSE